MRAIVIAITLLLSFSGQAQDYFHWISFAEQAGQEGDYEGAVHYYARAFELDSSKQELQYVYAEALEKSGRYQESLRLFSKIYSKGRGQFFPKGTEHIAQLKMYLGDYESAIKFWKRALRRIDPDEPRAEEVKQKMRKCAYALSNPLTNEELNIIALGQEVNTSQSEFGMELLGDSIFLFSSLRGTYDSDSKLEDPDSYHARIYRSKNSRYGRSMADTFHIPLSESSLHLANPSWSAEEEKLYFTIQDEQGQASIYRRDLAENQILERLPAPINIEGCRNSQPHVFQVDGKSFMIFSSDREGGSGTWDIYLVGLDQMEILDLGTGINSPGNEVCPFYDEASQILYFSSDWHEGYGGYDIFSCEWSPEASSSKIKNLGLPTNSSVNDLYYKRRNKSSYLSSNRYGSISDDAGYCCMDIYTIKESEVDSLPIRSDEIPSSIRDVSELADLLPITLYFHNDVPDSGSRSNITELDYRTTIEEYLNLKEEYLRHYSEGQSSSTADSSKQRMNEFFEEEVKAEFAELEAVTLLLAQELEKGVELEIAIKGYASPLAQSDYNRKLTQRRIMCVRNYLSAFEDGRLREFMNGDDPSLRIVEIPYGESESDQYVSDNPQDQKGSIYSVAAAKERKVEILQIKEK